MFELMFFFSTLNWGLSDREEKRVVKIICKGMGTAFFPGKRTYNRGFYSESTRLYLYDSTLAARMNKGDDIYDATQEWARPIYNSNYRQIKLGKHSLVFSKEADSVIKAFSETYLEKAEYLAQRVRQEESKRAHSEEMKQAKELLLSKNESLKNYFK